MKTIRDAIAAYNELDINDRMTFYITLTSLLDSDTENVHAVMMETRFQDGIHCLHCGSSHYVKNGHRPDGTQRYLCRDCGKSFLETTDSVVSHSHKKYSVWKKYLSCMMEKKTLQKSAAECGISTTTAFFWRHKILSVLETLAGRICLSGIVEADETYQAVSYKGNHSKSRTFTMPREPHRRGGDVSRKGLSNEQVCIPCAVSRPGTAISGVGKLGKVSSSCISRMFNNRFSADTTLCTDHEKAYLRFAKASGIHLIQMETDRRTSGEYGIQRINAYHSRLKGFLRGFHGVSTKHLGYYLVWHDLMFCSARKGQELEDILWKTALGRKFPVSEHAISGRLPLPAGD